MSAVADIVTALMTDAGKTSTADKKYAEGAVRRTIQAINRAMNNWVVASRNSAISVAANAKTVTLPTDVRRVKDLGRYDSGTDRIDPLYGEISERDFHERYSGVSSLTAREPNQYNEWFFLDDASTGALKVRLVFPPSSAFTMMVTFYEKLTEVNADKLDDEDLIYNGSVGRMVGWFPKIAASYFYLYEQALDEMRASRRSSRRVISEKMNPRIESHNQIMSYLVD